MKCIKRFKTVSFFKLAGGEEHYEFTSVNNCVKTLVYSQEDGGFVLSDCVRRTSIELMPEARAQLISARKAFTDSLLSVLSDDGAFFLASGDGYYIAYRKQAKKDCKKEVYLYDKTEKSDFYRFIIFLGGGKVIQKLCTFDELMHCPYPSGRESSMSMAKFYSYRTRREDLLHEIVYGRGLYGSAEKHDRYLALSIKYLAEIATQEEADEASAVDGKVRFVPENRIYDDITVDNVEKIPKTFFNRSDRYSCTFVAGSRTWHATWYPGVRCLYVWQYALSPHSSRIEISEEPYEALCEKAGVTYDRKR
ncbi:MAG: hypothetical protein J1G38_01505 [Clostridiales bacterium]|nr:hypothetical protein [Clostridiales bacterium]